MSRQDGNKEAASFFAILGSAMTFAGSLAVFSGYRDFQKSKIIKEMSWTSILELPLKLDQIEKQRPDHEPSLHVKMTGKTDAEQPIITDFSKQSAAIYLRQDIGVYASLKSITFSANDPNSARFVKNELRKETPFYIHEGRQRIKVFVKPFNNKEPSLEKVHFVEEPAGNYFLSLILGTFGYKYPYSIIKSESILPLNRELFVVGQVTRKRDGTLRFSEPNTGLIKPKNPGVVTLKTEDEVVQDLYDSGFTKSIFGGLIMTAGLASFIGGIISYK